MMQANPARKFLLSLALLAFSVLALASAASAAGSGHAEGGARSRQKVIDFDDEVVEGVNKRPLDSLSQISERDRKRRKPHLYRKRAGFRSEMAETLHQLRYVQ